MNDLELLLNCPICGKKYGHQSAKIVQGNQGAFLVHVGCKHCGSASLAVISRSKGTENMVAMGMMTDLNYQEACDLLQQASIGSDEILDLYQSFNCLTK